MFEEIKKCFNSLQNTNSSRVLAEWTYFEGCYMLTLQKEINEISSFSYINLNNDNSTKLHILKNNNNQLFFMLVP